MEQPRPGLTIRELNPALLDDYLHLFDTAFFDFPEWSECYCGFYDTLGDNWDTSLGSAPEHRAARAELIKAGEAHGFLAFVDSKVVGWLNAQPRSNYRNMRRFTV